MSTQSIKDLAPWPATVEEVTVAVLRRYLLVWAKVYEARLWANAGRVLSEPVTTESADRTGTLVTAYQAMTSAGIWLGHLERLDPIAALEQARSYWCACDDGEMFADALLDALDAIDPELAEAVIVAVEAIEASR